MGTEGYQTSSGGHVIVYTDVTLQSGTPENYVTFLINAMQKF